MSQAKKQLKLADYAWTAGATTASSLLLAGVGLAGVANHLARKMLVPAKEPSENVRILSLGYASPTPGPQEQPTYITLEADEKTLAPGRYGFFFAGGAGFARLGQVSSYSPQEGSVTRPVEEVLYGDLSEAVRGRVSGVIAPTPQLAGYRAKDIELDLPVGPAPAWLIHPGASLDLPDNPAEPSETWAIMVHGMGATRDETLRALEATQQLGLTSLHMSYRNDRQAPDSSDRRYGLGYTEWRDVQVAIDYALAHGARQVVLFGWSMGGSICMQTADLARNRQAIAALVLDGPALDWLGLIVHHSKLNKIPDYVSSLSTQMMTKPHLAPLLGLAQPISLAQISWPHRAKDIRKPILILHSLDDHFVPAAPSQKLAQLSHLVDFVPFHQAPHTREWNVDPQGWTQAVTSWLSRQLRQPR